MDVLGGADPGRLFADAADDLVSGSSPEALRFHHRLEDLRPSFPAHELLQFIGCGGMGAGVFLARKRQTSNRVALKILPEDVATDLRTASRFEQEAEAMKALDHPNIVAIQEFGQSRDDDLYIVMDYVEGQTLAKNLSNAPLSIDQAIRFFIQMCSAIEYAHDKGIIHRDIKPANILIDLKGHLKVTDFGLAKWYESSRTVSQTGIAGTYGYIAPEQLAGLSQIDPRTDVYSLGVVLYQMLTGVLPIGAYVPASAKNRSAKPLDQAIAKALNPDPNERFQSVAEFRHTVQKQQQRATMRPWTLAMRWAITTVAAFLLIGGLLYWKSIQPNWTNAWKEFELLKANLIEPNPYPIRWTAGSGDHLQGQLTLTDAALPSYKLTGPESKPARFHAPLTISETSPLLAKFPFTSLFYWLTEELTIQITSSQTLTLRNAPWEDQESKELFLRAVRLLDQLENKRGFRVNPSTSKPTITLRDCTSFLDFCQIADPVLLPSSRPPTPWSEAWQSQADLKIATYELLRDPQVALPHPGLTGQQASEQPTVAHWRLRSRAQIIAAALCQSWLFEEPPENLPTKAYPSLIEHLLQQES